MQTKLLRFLQSGEFQRIGNNKIFKSEVCILAATNVDLVNAIEIREFREDLYYQLNVINLHIPPLRDRRTDIVAAHYFLKRFSLRKGLGEFGISAAALKALESYHFPGNVRELGNLIERSVLLCQGTEILDFGLNLKTDKTQLGESGKLKQSVGDLEAELIKKVFREASGNQSECARR